MPFNPQIWRSADIGHEENGVPDSCCHVETAGCGRNRFTGHDVTAGQHIHTHGCLTIMQHKLVDQVVPVLLGFAGVGVVLALVQLMAVVFALSYSAAIARYHKQADDQRSFRSAAANIHHSTTSTPRWVPWTDTK